MAALRRARSRIVRAVAASRVGRAAGRAVERIKRVYVAARGAGSRFIARNASARAEGILNGQGGRIVAIAVGTAAMVALVPLLRSWFKLDNHPQQAFWLAAIFGVIALLLWRFVKKPLFALAAGAVAGFIAGSEIISRYLAPAPAQLATGPAPGSLPDRVPSGAPIPSAQQQQQQRRGVTVGRPQVSAG